jgi:hypothetical protein
MLLTWLVFAPASAGQVAQAAAGPEHAIDGYVAALAGTQDARVSETLALIDGPGRRLLALRSYLRSGDNLVERWSWTAEQISAYEASAEYQARQAEIDRVRRAFSQANPGFELWVNPQVRSLEVQIENWNTNESVGEAAANILSATRELLAGKPFPCASSDEVRKAIQSFLVAHVPRPTPTIAAPGLSLHGQMRAVDFQVQKDGRTIASPRSATITSDWDEPGWSARLEAVVHATSSRFVGPLSSPREPWHYTYQPQAVAIFPRGTRQ